MQVALRRTGHLEGRVDAGDPRGSMNVLAANPAPRAERAASAVLYDHENARVVGFTMLPGQRIAEHRSNSTVLVHVIEGTGVFRGSDSDATLIAGQSASFAPGEVHAIDAGAEALRFIAVITPRPVG